MSEKRWEELVPGSEVSIADYRVPRFICRSHAIRLTDGSYAVVTPGAELTEAFAQEHPDARVRFVVASSNFHWMGIPAWLERFPEAVAVASDGARPRLLKKGLPVQAGLDELRGALPSSVDAFEMPGTRSGETWTRAETSEGVAWLVCDAFFNFRPPRKTAAKLTQKLLRSGPGLAISQIMKWGGFNDRQTARAWLLERIEADQPTILVPSHGDVLHDPELPGRLRALVDDRLG